MKKLRDFQQNHLLPLLVAYSTHPLHIFFALALWAALLAGGSITLLALTGGNYFNGLAGVIGCLTLGQVVHLHRQHSADMATLNARHDAHEESLRVNEALLKQLLPPESGVSRAKPARHQSPR